MNINYHAFLPHLGYGVAANGYIKLLREKFLHKTNWHIYQFDNKIAKTNLKDFEGKANLNFIHLTPNYIPAVFDDKIPNVLSTVFETTKFPEEWKSSLLGIEKNSCSLHMESRCF